MALSRQSKWLQMVCAMMAALAAACRLPAGETATLVLEQTECAGICGFRALWDTPVVLAPDGAMEVVDKGQFGKAPSAIWQPSHKVRANGTKPGAIAFDAIHRSLLVRFPGAAQRIADELKKGKVIVKAELVLPFKDYEFWPEGYAEPAGMSFMGDRWVKNPPNWHAIAWLLRQPWRADAQIGPTFNAYVNGIGFWRKYGGQDETADRFPLQFGPAEVSARQPEGRLDVTAVLQKEEFGKTLAARLRRLEWCGFLIRKWETYDTRYKDGWNGYEYGL
ncbi:MAG: hypothetical protein N3A66_11875, partial [Planctomycetota bacterium]|nr:hypothetical protein [Planctomycetota bacterium]